MIIIGELINTSRKKIGPAVQGRDVEAIQDLARKQVQAGAAYLDVNAGTISNEPEALSWLVRTVQAAVDAPLCLDSPNPRALEAALQVHRGPALVNSITAEREKFQALLPLLVQHRAKVVALCMDDRGIPETVEGRIEIAGDLAKRLAEAGIQMEDIFFDPLVKPVSVSYQYGKEVLEAIRQIRQKYPQSHIACGLSNVSFGMPDRKLLNQAFLVLCMANGLDSVILDPLDKTIMSLLTASETLLGQDPYCRKYLAFYRRDRGRSGPHL